MSNKAATTPDADLQPLHTFRRHEPDPRCLTIQAAVAADIDVIVPS